MLPWTVDRAVAGDAAGALGWAPGDGVPALVAALLRRVAAGTTAKREAVAAGLLPPGSDPDALWRDLLRSWATDLPTPAWSCWVHATLFASLVETLERRRTSVCGVRRIDPSAPPVDVHAAVVTHDDAGSWLVDPFFGMLVGGPGTDEVERIERGVYGLRSDGADGRWSYRVGVARWSRVLRYRCLAPDLGPDDVAAFCAVSVTHSGVPDRRLARVHDRGTIVAITDRPAGVELRAWHPAEGVGVWSGHLDERRFGTWDEACADLSYLTGARIR